MYCDREDQGYSFNWSKDLTTKLEMNISGGVEKLIFACYSYSLKLALEKMADSSMSGIVVSSVAVLNICKEP